MVKWCGGWETHTDLLVNSYNMIRRANKFMTSRERAAPGSCPMLKDLADNAGQPSDREEKREEYGHHHDYQDDALGASRHTIEGQ